MKKGLFIVIEGLDGSGSTTQCELLRNYLDIKGIKAIVTKEPTNNLIGGLIRGVLTGDWKINPEGLQLLFSADRAHHLEKEIIPALQNGVTVICDRYFYSSLAFGAVDCDIGWLKLLNQQFLNPDISFFLNTNPETCIQRMSSSRVCFELFENKEKLAKVLSNYHQLIQEYSDLNLIDAEKDKETILKDIVKKVEELLTNRSIS
ncbi:MAG: dTMP kinase [Candidatus Woesearchaeota archaeon]